MTFLTPGNLIFSSQIPNSTFPSRSQVKIGFLLLKFRLFTPRNLIFSALHSKNSKSQVKIRLISFLQRTQIQILHSQKSDFFFSEPKVKIGFISFLQRTQISIFHSQKSDFFFSEPKVKIGFHLLKFRLFTPRNLIFSAFYSEIEKLSQNRIFLLLRTQISIFHSKKYVFLFFSEPKFNFSLQESSQNRISSSQISTFHSKKSDFSSFLL